MQGQGFLSSPFLVIFGAGNLSSSGLCDEKEWKGSIRKTCNHFVFELQSALCFNQQFCPCTNPRMHKSSQAPFRPKTPWDCNRSSHRQFHGQLPMLGKPLAFGLRSISASTKVILAWAWLKIGLSKPNFGIMLKIINPCGTRGKLKDMHKILQDLSQPAPETVAKLWWNMVELRPSWRSRHPRKDTGKLCFLRITTRTERPMSVTFLARRKHRLDLSPDFAPDVVIQMHIGCKFLQCKWPKKI